MLHLNTEKTKEPSGIISGIVNKLKSFIAPKDKVEVLLEAIRKGDFNLEILKEACTTLKVSSELDITKIWNALTANYKPFWVPLCVKLRILAKKTQIAKHIKLYFPNLIAESLKYFQEADRTWIVFLENQVEDTKYWNLENGESEFNDVERLCLLLLDIFCKKLYFMNHTFTISNRWKSFWNNHNDRGDLIIKLLTLAQTPSIVADVIRTCVDENLLLIAVQSLKVFLVE